MNRQHPVLISLALAMGSLLTSSCSDDCDDLPVYGTDANITTFTVTAPEFSKPAIIQGDEVMLVTDCFTDLTEAKATVTLSEGASIEPLPETITDWAAPHDFTVTSANGKVTKTYHYSVLQDAVELSTQAEVNAYGATKPVWAGNIVINDSEENPITDLSPLSSLKEIEYGLTISSCHAATVSLPALETAKSIVIDGNVIESISIPKVKGLLNLRLGYTTRLKDLKSMDFSSLKHIYGDFVLFTALAGDENYALTGFESLEVAEGETVFSFYSADLRAFRSLKSVNHISMIGTIKSFAGFENLKEVKGIFTCNMLRSDATFEGFRPNKVWAINFANIQSLEDLSFLENVTSMYSLVIQGAFKLTSLKGVENLRKIEDEIYIAGAVITDLDPLSNLENVGRAITFKNNSKLKDFSGLKRCLPNFKGKWTVQNNGANPTIEEILNQ